MKDINLIFWVTRQTPEKIAEKIEQLQKDKDKEIEVITNNAISLIGSNACDSHSKEIKVMSFPVFKESLDSIGCPFCLKEHLEQKDKLLKGCKFSLDTVKKKNKLLKARNEKLERAIKNEINWQMERHGLASQGLTEALNQLNEVEK